MEHQGLRILFDSKNEKYKKPFGALKEGQVCYFNILVPKSCPAKKVCFVLEKDGEKEVFLEMKPKEMRGEYISFELYTSIDRKGLYFYWFFIEKDNGAFRLFKYGYNDTNIEEGDKWQIICYDKNYKAPSWGKNAVYYQIFPDRFYKSGECNLKNKIRPYKVHKNLSDCPDWYPDEQGNWNTDFFGGNLKGITEKLDYIKSIGADVIYLNPIVKAFSNHRYDSADYIRVDPMLGDEDDFRNLCTQAHKRNMKIVIDGVFSHTGNRSIYFENALKNITSPYYNWYDFKRFPDDYTAWWGIKTLPQIKKGHPGFIKFITDNVIPFWLGLGADGIRLDVADELTDEFIEKISESAKKVKDSVIIGEVWEDASNKISYGTRRKYFYGNELDSVMNYPFLNLICGFIKGDKTANSFADGIMTIVENYPPEMMCSCMNMLSTHDTVRILTLLGAENLNKSREEKAFYRLSGPERKKGEELLRISAFLQFILPGSPSIYYGDEIGMEGFEDPFNRRFYEWDNTNYELKDFFKTLCHIKHTEPSLQNAHISFDNKDNVLVLKRNYIEAVVNLTDKQFEVNGKILLSQNFKDNKIFKNGFALIKK